MSNGPCHGKSEDHPLEVEAQAKWVTVRRHTTKPPSKTPMMFSEIASRYDFLNHFLSLNADRRWRRCLVEDAAVKPGGKVLDACTGTGDIAIDFAKKSHAGEIVGIDRSGEMLRVGVKKLENGGLKGKVKLLEGDVLDLPFSGGVFDVVSIGFGLRNLSDYRKGLSEMVRVLAAGGRLFILEFAPPREGLLGKSYRFYLERFIPAVGGLISGSKFAYEYLSTSIGDFLTGDEVRGLMNAEGLLQVSARSLSGGIAFLYKGIMPYN